MSAQLLAATIVSLLLASIHARVNVGHVVPFETTAHRPLGRLALVFFALSLAWTLRDPIPIMSQTAALPLWRVRALHATGIAVIAALVPAAATGLLEETAARSDLVATSLIFYGAAVSSLVFWGPELIWSIPVMLMTIQLVDVGLPFGIEAWAFATPGSPARFGIALVLAVGSISGFSIRAPGRPIWTVR